MPETKVAVVILNYNGKHHLQKFLPSVVEHSQGYTIYIADNCSKDDSVSFVKSSYPEIQLINNPKNLGYAEGYNQALKHIHAQYYILLNSDVEVSAGWIDTLLEALENNPEAAACQPKLLDYRKRDFFEYAGASGGYIDTLGYPFCRGRLFDQLERDNAQYNSSVEIFWASGACLLVRAEVFHRAGGLDGDFFAHMEEIDLCWRIKNLGYSILVEPRSTVYHLGGGTLEKQSTKKTYLNFRNNFSTLFKNEKGNKLFYKIPLRLVLDGIAGIKFLFSGQVLHTIAILKAHFHFYLRIPSLIKKRRQIRSLPGFRHSKTGVYKGSIVFERYVLGRKTFSELEQGFFS
ncbi:MAG: glycosyltransferase family 2 protein [Bacteroidia bacterium]|nr:glycosyltransferase family 2 protein [Bacteroidia bacterium]